MVLKTEREGVLLAASKKFDQALSRYDLSPFHDLLDNEVVLHKDNLTLKTDIHGRNAVIAYFQARPSPDGPAMIRTCVLLQTYVDRYDYQHVPIAGAVDEREGEGGVAFSLSVDRQVLPRPSAYKEKHEAGETFPTDTTAIYYHRFNMEGKIRSIYFLRQLSVDEAKRKLKTVPDTSTLHFNPEKYKGQQGEQNEERAQKHARAASMYTQVHDIIWRTGKVSSARDIMADNVVLRNMIYVENVQGEKKTGVDAIENMIKTHFQDWTLKDYKSSVAVTAGDKAFIWWSTTIEFQYDWATNYGLSMIVFNDQDKIAEVDNFMQPFPAERH